MSLNGKLPLVGNDLKKAAQATKGVDLVGALDFQKYLTDGLTGLADPKVSDVKTKVLAPIAQAIAGTGVLLDTDYPGDTDSVPSATDVLFNLDCSPTSGIQECTDGESIADIYGIQVQAGIGQGSGARTAPPRLVPAAPAPR